LNPYSGMQLGCFDPDGVANVCDCHAQP
jgi:hypothetical protein